MKCGWQVKKLGEIYDVRDGTHDSPKYQDEGYPLITSKNLGSDGLNYDNIKYISELDFKKINERSAVHKGDILFAMIGTIGNPVVVEVKPNFAIKNVALFKVPPEQNSFFLKYYLESDFVQEKMLYEAKGTTQRFVGLGYLRDFPIWIPELPEQQRIVAILDEAFTAIAKAKENIEKNLQNAHDIFESYLLGAFTNPGNDWELKKLDDVCEISSMLVDPRHKEYLDLPHIGGANIASKTGKLIEIKTAREEGLISGKYAFDETMVLYSKIRPYLMKVARPNFKGLCSADIYPLSIKPDQIDRDYLFHLLLSPKFTEYANAGSARAGMPKVNRDHLFAFSFPLPSVTTQKQLVTKIDVLHEETQRLGAIYQKKLVALEELKKSILQKAFSGELASSHFIQQEMVWA